MKVRTLAAKACRLLGSEGGFTLDVSTGYDLRGLPAFAVNVPGTEAVFSVITRRDVRRTLARVRSFAAETVDVCFGGWRCHDRPVVVLAAVRLFGSLDDARDWGAANRQRFVYGLERGVIIPTAVRGSSS